MATGQDAKIGDKTRDTAANAHHKSVLANCTRNDGARGHSAHLRPDVHGKADASTEASGLGRL
jgi:hypothetical protein